MIFLKIFKFFSVTLIFFSFIACSSQEEKEQSSHATQMQYDIEIGYAAWPGYEIVYYPQVKRIFQKYGIRVKITRFSDQESACRALSDMKIDAVLTSVWDTLLLNSNNNFHIILATDISYGSDGIVANNTIHSVKDLQGKKISAQNNAINMLILREALQKSGMSYKDVTIVDITNEEALAEIYHKNIDAAVLWEPLLLKTKEKIDGNIIFTTKEVNSSVIDVLAVNDLSFQSKKKVWEKFLFSWYDTMKVLQKNPQEVMSIIERETINPNFSQNYQGLKPGTLALNKELFLQGKLQKSTQKIKSYIQNSNEPHVIISTDFVKQSIKKWEQTQ